jgi:hypothetical protein
MANFDQKFQYFKICFVFVILLYLFFITTHQNDQDISSNNYSNIHVTKQKATVICDKICANKCIDENKSKPIDIVTCMKNCACPEETLKFKNKIDKKMSIHEILSHIIIIGFAMIIILFLYKNFHIIIKPSEVIPSNLYKRLSTQDEYSCLKQCI